MAETFELWGRSSNEEQPTLRPIGTEHQLRSEGARLARASDDEGVLSIWVKSPSGEIVWAAGEKAAEHWLEEGWADA
jgi:hypothetical protein